MDNAADQTTYSLASFFAGVGGIDLGFEQTGRFHTTYANEVDPYPAATFDLNFDVTCDVRDVREVRADDIGEVDVVVGGFPCQAFSIEGKREGFTDTKDRGNLFFELARITDEVRPKAVMFENVKNLVSHDHGDTLRVIEQTIADLGYTHSWRVLGAHEYGNVPQNRERIYIVAFADEDAHAAFEFPEPVARTVTIDDIVDRATRQDDKLYYRPGGRGDRLYQQLHEAVSESGRNAVYQRRRGHVRTNRSGLVPTLTAAMGMGGHNVPIIVDDYGYRKLTVRECFAMQGFPDDFALPAGMAPGRLYKQSGNSVAVPVVRRIAANIAAALDVVS